VQAKEDVQKFLEITLPFQKKYGYDLCSVSSTPKLKITNQKLKLVAYTAL